MCACSPSLLFPLVASVFCLPSSCFSEWYDRYSLVSADRFFTVTKHLQIDLYALQVFLEQGASDPQYGPSWSVLYRLRLDWQTCAVESGSVRDKKSRFIIEQDFFLMSVICPIFWRWKINTFLLK